MSSWGTKRRNLIITIFLTTVFMIVAIIGFVFFYEESTCFDGKQNGDETGVDCGGSCVLICSDVAIDPLVRWNRFFEVAPGVYNAIAYIENQNPGAKTDNLEYKFTLYDKNGAILKEKNGSSKLMPRKVTPIVENSLTTGKLAPARMSFEITSDIVWKKSASNESVISIIDDRLIQENDGPRVKATLENIGYSKIKDLKVVVILYNNEDNAIGVSSTYLESIEANRRENILFTWPQNFSGNVARFEIIPLYEVN